MAFPNAFTLVEVLTVITVISLLLSLTLPAVQRARESARRAACLNNLRQIGLAVLSYESQYGCYPFAMGAPVPGTPARGSVLKQFSAYTQIAAYLDSHILYNSINFQVGAQDTYIFPGTGSGAEANLTAMGTRLGALLCPSDGASNTQGPTGPSNYRVNLGTEIDFYPTDGPFSGRSPVGPASVTDGTSMTAALCEKLRGFSDGSGHHPRTDILTVPVTTTVPADQYLSLCRSSASYTAPYRYYPKTGLNWFIGTLTQTCYNHMITPNSDSVDCTPGLSNPLRAAVGPRSSHGPGVNLGFSDGSARFVKSTVHRHVWAALGSRNGNEVLSADDF